MGKKDSDYREKQRQRCREWRKRNAEKVKAYRDANKEHQRVYKIGHRKKTAEKTRAYNKKWYAENRQKRIQYENKRRARSKQGGEHYTAEQISTLFEKQKGKCPGCFCSIKDAFQVDHIMPLARGGSNAIANIQLLCPTCNNTKNAKDPMEWAWQNGQLL